MVDHSVDSVIAEKSLMWCLLPALAIVRCDRGVARNGRYVVVVDIVDVATIDMAVVVAGSMLLVLFKNNVAIVDTSILAALYLRIENILQY